MIKENNSAAIMLLNKKRKKGKKNSAKSPWEYLLTKQWMSKILEKYSPILKSGLIKIEDKISL